MFEEFNKKKIIEDFPAPVSAKMYPKEVLEIHNEFNTALAVAANGIGLGDRLRNEACAKPVLPAGTVNLAGT